MNQVDIEKIRTLAFSMNLITVEDMCKHSIHQLVLMIATKVNELIEHLKTFEGSVNETLETQNNNIKYLLDEGLLQEVLKVFDGWMSDGTFEELINQTALSNINDKVDSITLLMPPPSTLEENTKKLQSLLDIAKTGKHSIKIKIPKGTYDLHTCVIYSNTTIEMTNETKIIHHLTPYFNPETNTNKNINILFMNAKPFDNEDSNITKYNGNSNIHITGGVLDCYSTFLFCHGRNITIENVRLLNAKADHYIQIGACENVLIKNCMFDGMVNSAVDRQYVEMIQVDWMTSKAQPYWVSTADIFDRTINNGIVVDNCHFKKGCGDYAYMKTCIGSHSSDGENINKNITIKNCLFDDFEYSGLVIDHMEKVIIENNVFKTTTETNLLRITNSKSVEVRGNNHFYGSRRGILCVGNDNIYIDGCVFHDNTTSDSDFILIGECNNANLKNITFKDSKTTGYYILIRNCTDTSVIGCKDINCTSELGAFTRVYTRNDGVNTNIVVRDNITSINELSKSSVNSLICGDYETIFRGDVSSGNIDLLDDISKFDDLKLIVSWYGKSTKDLVFHDNTFVDNMVNMPDNLYDGLQLAVCEGRIDYIDEKTLSLVYTQQINIGSDGTLTKFDEPSYRVRKIIGKRRYL